MLPKPIRRCRTRKNERTFAQALLKERMLDGPVRSRTVSKSKRLERLDVLKQCQDALQSVREIKRLAANFPDVLRELQEIELFLVQIVESNPSTEEAVDDQKVSRLPRQSSLEMCDKIAKRTNVYLDALEKIWEWLERFVDDWLNGSGGQC